MWGWGVGHWGTEWVGFVVVGFFWVFFLFFFWGGGGGGHVSGSVPWSRAEGRKLEAVL